MIKSRIYLQNNSIVKSFLVEDFLKIRLLTTFFQIILTYFGNVEDLNQKTRFYILVSIKREFREKLFLPKW